MHSDFGLNYLVTEKSNYATLKLANETIKELFEEQIIIWKELYEISSNSVFRQHNIWINISVSF